MRKVADAAAEFLACKRIAVTGVSRDPAGHGANVVYDRLKARGYEVFAVNPNAEEIDGGCPLMYPPASDAGHRVMRWVCKLSDVLPKQV